MTLILWLPCVAVSETFVGFLSSVTGSVKIEKAAGNERVALKGEVLGSDDVLTLSRNARILLDLPGFEPLDEIYYQNTSGTARRVSLRLLVTEHDLAYQVSALERWHNVVRKAWHAIFEVSFAQGVAGVETRSPERGCDRVSIDGCILPLLPVVSPEGGFKMIWPVCDDKPGTGDLTGPAGSIKPSMQEAGQLRFSDLPPGSYRWQVNWGARSVEGTLEVLGNRERAAIQNDIAAAESLASYDELKVLTRAAVLSNAGALIAAGDILNDAAAQAEKLGTIDSWRMSIFHILSAGTPRCY